MSQNEKLEAKRASSGKDLLVAYALWATLGLLGAHRF